MTMMNSQQIKLVFKTDDTGEYFFIACDSCQKILWQGTPRLFNLSPEQVFAQLAVDCFHHAGDHKHGEIKAVEIGRGPGRPEGGRFQ